MRDNFIKLLNKKNYKECIIKYAEYKNYSNRDIKGLLVFITYTPYLTDVILRSIYIEFNIITLSNSNNQPILYY